MTANERMKAAMIKPKIYKYCGSLIINGGRISAIFGAVKLMFHANLP